MRPGDGRTDVGTTIPQLLGASVLGDGFGALGHRVLGQLAGQKQAHGSLDLTRSDRRPA